MLLTRPWPYLLILVLARALAAAEPAPESDPLTLSLRGGPTSLLFTGDSKQGPRGRTRRLNFQQDLDIAPILGGFFLDGRLQYKSIFSLGSSYHFESSLSRSRKVQRDPLFFDKTFIPLGATTRSTLQFDWVCVDGGAVFDGDYYHVEILLGVRYLQTALDVRSPNAHTIAREKGFHFYFPGVIADLKLTDGLDFRFESRSSFLAIPIGPQIFDARGGFRYKSEAIRVGLGVQLLRISIFREENKIRTREVNNYKEINIDAAGLFLEFELRF